MLLFTNNPAISLSLIEGIKKLDEDETYDSAFSVSTICSALQEQEIVDDKIESFVPLNLIGNVNSIRSSQGDVYFCDLG